MEIRIGVQNVSREIAIDTDMSADAVAAAVAAAAKGGTLDLTDAKGRRVVVPGAALGYVDIGEETKRRVGFGA
ncbi:DUF3107 domain-containing protein [Demequina sp. SYSU T00192]|uniref:DUF3107 domain-containing protein n=1 Tax=Demequina litoralis TaxID=3051660 RepID=A0ABT8G727_9MICO|nr:DUF3107 domain-containing protein [Demequina sp. SYSU T00192]MDN4474947.1 DUF3107 domain-containing protein [Demequina sp. SYSU T00192]